MLRFPVIYSFVEIVAGRGFFARVLLHGKALSEEEPGDCTFYAVEPSGFAGVGCDRSAAYLDFKAMFKRILFDAAAESDGFAAFKREVERIGNLRNAAMGADWQSAVADVRAGRVKVDWAKVVEEYPPPKVTVAELEPAPEANRIEDERPPLAAAA